MKINNLGLTSRGDAVFKALRMLTYRVAKLELHVGHELECEVSAELRSALKVLNEANEPLSQRVVRALNKGVVETVLEELTDRDLAAVEHLAHSIIEEKGLHGVDGARKAWTEAVLVILYNLGYLKQGE